MRDITTKIIVISIELPFVVKRKSDEPDCFTQQIWLIFSSISKLLR